MTKNGYIVKQSISPNTDQTINSVFIRSHNLLKLPLIMRVKTALQKGGVEVSEFDCLRDEGINYAEALQKGGVVVFLNQTKGTIHGFEMNIDSA